MAGENKWYAQPIREGRKWLSRFTSGDSEDKESKDSKDEMSKDADKGEKTVKATERTKAPDGGQTASQTIDKASVSTVPKSEPFTLPMKPLILGLGLIGAVIYLGKK